MGTCIICGTTTDGEVCSTHQEDVAFVFEGNSPDQLTPNRYYKGTVDGYADFGVFVDVGDAVTGLLHRSEIDSRLDNLGWEPGDEVFVQVQGVRDNGNVDLGWSIRQSEREFRGLIVDAPDGERQPDEQESEDVAAGGGGNAGGEVRQRQSATSTTAGAVSTDSEREADSVDASDASTDDVEDDAGVSDDSGATDVADTDEPDDAAEAAGDQGDDAEAIEDETDDVEATENDAGDEPTDADVDSLPDRVDDLVRIEGEVTGVRQTSGPTIFELRDETGTIECAAFEEAGVRAYPEVEVGDFVRLDGVVERRRGELQVETETLLVLTGDERAAVEAAIEEAIEERLRPDEVRFVAEDDPAEALEDEIGEAATALRRAIAEARPVVVRHSADADGYAGGAAIERAALELLDEQHNRSDARYHYFARRPLDDPVYGMDAVTTDVTRMLETRERHGEQLPLVVLVGLGSTEEAYDAFDLLDVYDVDRVVIDDARPDDGLEEAAGTVVNPHLADATGPLPTASAMAAAVAATARPEVADDLAHVPAVSYWEDLPEAYAAAADAAEYDEAARRRIREALALEAHYQAYNDKRELVADILFDGAPGLSEHVADQFREKLETELSTAEENVVVRDAGGVRFAVLDTDAFTHRFDFPPTELLLDVLHRNEREAAEGAAVSVGVGDDELHLRSTEPLDVRRVADEAAEDVPGIAAVGGRDGHVEFLPGNRDAALEAVIAAIAGRIDA